MVRLVGLCFALVVVGTTFGQTPPYIGQAWRYSFRATIGGAETEKIYVKFESQTGNECKVTLEVNRSKSVTGGAAIVISGTYTFAVDATTNSESASRRVLFTSKDVPGNLVVLTYRDLDVDAKEQVSILIERDADSCKAAKEAARKAGFKTRTNICDPDMELLVRAS